MPYMALGAPRESKHEQIPTKSALRGHHYTCHLMKLEVSKPCSKSGQDSSFKNIWRRYNIL